MRSACATTRFGPQKQRLVTSAVGRWPRQRPEATDQRATWSAEAAHRWRSLHVRDTNLQPQRGDRTPYRNITWSTSIYKFHKSLSVILSVSLYLAYLANLSHDRLCARPVCCTGTRECAPSSLRLFRCEQLAH